MIGISFLIFTLFFIVLIWSTIFIVIDAKKYFKDTEVTWVVLWVGLNIIFPLVGLIGYLIDRHGRKKKIY